MIKNLASGLAQSEKMYIFSLTRPTLQLRVITLKRLRTAFILYKVHTFSHKIRAMHINIQALHVASGNQN